MNIGLTFAFLKYISNLCLLLIVAVGKDFSLVVYDFNNYGEFVHTGVTVQLITVL